MEVTTAESTQLAQLLHQAATELDATPEKRDAYSSASRTAAAIVVSFSFLSYAWLACVLLEWRTSAFKATSEHSLLFKNVTKAARSSFGASATPHSI